MAQVIVAMESQSNYTVGEHVVRRMLAGDIEGVRGRLVYALERLDYQVVSENPVLARRAARKGHVRADFLDYARKLSVSLRPSSAAATVATFDFAVVHGGLMTDGDKKTLELEADAVIALAAAPPDAGFCRNCGTGNPGDARFCRLCGAPGTGSEPAELEVVRLTAGARASLQEVVVGLLIAVAILALTLPMIFFGKPKLVNIGWVLLAVGQALAWWMTLYGVFRLYRTLNPKGERARQLRAAAFAPALHAEHPSHTSALPPAPARVSVTEGTTELLTPTPRRERPDTNPFERSRQ